MHQAQSIEHIPKDSEVPGEKKKKNNNPKNMKKEQCSFTKINTKYWNYFIIIKKNICIYACLKFGQVQKTTDATLEVIFFQQT